MNTVQLITSVCEYCLFVFLVTSSAFLSDLHSRSSREAEADEEEMQNRDGKEEC